MAAGEITQGRRRSDGTLPHDLIAGDYALASGGERVWLCSPVGEPGSVDCQWKIVIENDGTITIDPSIWCNKDASPPGWHGYLKHGVWQEV